MIVPRGHLRAFYRSSTLVQSHFSRHAEARTSLGIEYQPLLVPPVELQVQEQRPNVVAEPSGAGDTRGGLRDSQPWAHLVQNMGYHNPKQAGHSS